MGRYRAGVGGGGELVRHQCPRPLFGPDPIREPVREVAVQAQVVQILECTAEHRSLFDGVVIRRALATILRHDYFGTLAVGKCLPT